MIGFPRRVHHEPADAARVQQFAGLIALDKVRPQCQKDAGRRRARQPQASLQQTHQVPLRPDVQRDDAVAEREDRPVRRRQFGQFIEGGW